MGEDGKKQLGTQSVDMMVIKYLCFKATYLVSHSDPTEGGRWKVDPKVKGCNSDI